MSRGKSKSRTRLPEKSLRNQLRIETARVKRTGEELRSHLDEVSEQYQALKLQFILTELDLASTFCDVASSAANEERAQRNLKNARQAYGSAARFLSTAELAPAEMREVSGKMELLRAQLQDLGQPEPPDQAPRSSAANKPGE